MSQDSAIEWTDATWNPVRGCTKVSPGCAHCYAETFAERWRGVKGHAYEQGFDLRLVPEKLDEPLRRKKPTTYFVNSMSDLFQEGVPDAFIDRVFAVMALAPKHTFQLLTKRAERMRAYCSTLGRHHGVDRVSVAAKALQPDGPGFMWTMGNGGWHLPNVWLGVSVENQHFADERIPLLLQTPAAVRFISAEPLLGSVDLDRGGWSFLRPLRPPPGNHRGHERGLDWVIVGGESGPGARPCHTEWIGDLVKQCRSAGVPVFVKQMGSVPYVQAARLRHWEWRHIKRAEDRRFTHAVDDALGWRVHLASSKGGDMAEWPDDLRVREFPACERSPARDAVGPRPPAHRTGPRA